MTCESTRGTWGQPCPDCGQTLPPKPGPLTSWQAQRSLVDDGRKVNGGARIKPDRMATPRQVEAFEAVREHGSMMAAARALGVHVATISVHVRRYSDLTGEELESVPSKGGRPRGTTERQAEIARIVAKHGGNKKAAARELGMAPSSVIASMRRYRANTA